MHQKIKEGSKERVQIFEGFVIRTRRKNSLTSTITVRRIASGVGVEKTFMLNSPLLVQVEVVKRSKVRRKYLSYMRQRHGKSARLAGIDFDKEAVNLSVEEQQNLDAGLDKTADIEELEAQSKQEKAAKKPEDSKDDKGADEKSETKKPAKEEAKTEPDSEKSADSSDDKDKAPAESEPEKLSKEEKAKLKKEKAKAFQQKQADK